MRPPGSTDRKARLIEQLHDLPEPRNSRVLRAVLFITLGLAAMALIAYGFGQVTRTEWVWWLAPLTVAVDGCLLLRARVSDRAASLSPFAAPILVGPQVPFCVASYVATAAMAAGGAYAGNRAAVIAGAALAILGNGLEQAENPREHETANTTTPQDPQGA